MTNNRDTIKKLLGFLNIDGESQQVARQLAELLSPHLEHIVDHFYRRVVTFDINPHVTNLTISALKPKQKQHWLSLLHTQFDDNFFTGLRRIGMRHREIELDTMWYVAGYTMLKIEFVEVILKSNHTHIMKGRMIKTLDQYIAVDTALALSAYDVVVLD